MRAIRAYVHDIDPPAADTVHAKCRAELSEINFAYSGTP